MGKSPDEIERDIRQRREWISQRISSVQTRVQDNVESLKSGVSETAGGSAEGLKDSLHIDQLGTQMDRHPLSMLAGAFGAGVVLGVVTDPGGQDGAGSSDGRGKDRERSNGGGSSFIGGLADSVMGTAGETLQEGLRHLVRDGISSMANRREERPAAGSGY